jgi:MFS family permease
LAFLTSPGLSSAPLMPALQGAWYWWSLPAELTVAITIQTSGIAIGNCISAIGTGLLIQSFNWQMSFYVSGLLMMFIGVLWLLLVDSKPEIDRSTENFSILGRLKISARMTQKEKNLIQNSRGTAKSVVSFREVPWLEIFKCFPLLAKAMVWFAMSYMIYNATNNLPTYLSRVHNMGISEISSIFGIVTIITMLVNLAVAMCADKMRRVMPSTLVRKIIASGLTIIFVPCSLYINWLKCEKTTIIVCIAVYIMFASSLSSKLYFDSLLCLNIDCLCL